MDIDINLLLQAIIAIFAFLTAFEEKWRRSNKKEKVELAAKLVNNKELAQKLSGTILAVKKTAEGKKLLKPQLEDIATKIIDLGAEVEKVDWEQM